MTHAGHFTSSLGLEFALVALIAGAAMGYASRYLARGRPGGDPYAPGDHYRLAAFVLGVSLYQTWLTYGVTLHTFGDARVPLFWASLWSIMLAYGVLVGFGARRSKRGTKLPPVTDIPDE